MVDFTKIDGSSRTRLVAQVPEMQEKSVLSKNPPVIPNTPNTSNNPDASTSSALSFKACVAVAAEWGAACLGFKIDPGGLADKLRSDAYKPVAAKPGVGKDPQTGLDKVS